MVLCPNPRSANHVVTYAGKSLGSWFYSSRTDFFQESVRNAAQAAFDALGTNAVPFLLSQLQCNEGDGEFYFTFYKALPTPIRKRFHYPISGDDIRSIALGHLGRMRHLSREQVQALADLVPEFENPRLRMAGFNVMLIKHQTDHAFLPMCRRLISDPHPGIRLKGAISLAESSIEADPGEPRLFPILLEAMESKRARHESIEIAGYAYQQQPPGGVPGFIPPLPKSRLIGDPDDSLRDELGVALARLSLYLPQSEKELLRQARQRGRGEANELSGRAGKP